MTRPDSIRNEIDYQRGEVDEGVWLASKGLIEASDIPFGYELIQDWYRPGAESYILDFCVNSPNLTKRIIAKACIKMCASAAVQEWLGRRSVVKEIGVETPDLYSIKGACYLEEHIPLTLREAYHGSDSENRTRLKEDFCTSYQGLLAAGFQPLSLHDARSHGSDVVLVDFGFDLGGFSSASQPSGDTASTERRILDDFQRIVR